MAAATSKPKYELNAGQQEEVKVYLQLYAHYLVEHFVNSMPKVMHLPMSINFAEEIKSAETTISPLKIEVFNSMNAVFTTQFQKGPVTWTTFDTYGYVQSATDWPGPDVRLIMNKLLENVPEKVKTPPFLYMVFHYYSNILKLAATFHSHPPEHVRLTPALSEMQRISKHLTSQKK